MNCRRNTHTHIFFTCKWLSNVARGSEVDERRPKSVNEGMKEVFLHLIYNRSGAYYKVTLQQHSQYGSIGESSFREREQGKNAVINRIPYFNLARRCNSGKMSKSANDTIARPNGITCVCCAKERESKKMEKVRERRGESTKRE